MLSFFSSLITAVDVYCISFLVFYSVSLFERVFVASVSVSVYYLAIRHLIDTSLH